MSDVVGLAGWMPGPDGANHPAVLKVNQELDELKANAMANQIDDIMAGVAAQVSRDIYADPLPPWADVAPAPLSRWERFWRNVRARYWFTRERLARAICPYGWDD